MPLLSRRNRCIQRPLFPGANNEQKKEAKPHRKIGDVARRSPLAENCLVEWVQNCQAKVFSQGIWIRLCK
jgi:hypothetical protein